MMEYKDFQFRIQFMVSSYNHVENKDGPRRNIGFFKGKGRKSAVMRLEELEKFLQFSK